MNERIIKLFMQSVDTNYVPLPIEEHIPSWTEKFAELIVRECAHIAWLYDEPKLSGHGSIIANRIESHFGIED